MVIEMNLNKLSCKEFGMVGAILCKSFFVFVFFHYTASQSKAKQSKTKQQTFPINRDSYKARSVLWTLVGRCGFEALPHLPGHHPITIKTKGPSTVYGGKARERLMTD